MATWPVDVVASFLDAGPKIATARYRLKLELVDDGSNMDTVIALAADLKTALDVLTWDKVTAYSIEVIVPGGGAAPNVAANNQIHAYIRMTDSAGEQFAVDVPAWDDDTFDRDADDNLSAAFVAAADDLRQCVANPENGSSGYQVEWAQSRTHRTRGKVRS